MKKLGKQDKKAVSNIIGYMLLVTIVLVLSFLVYQWLKTYVPTDGIECPDGVSVYTANVKYECNSNHLNFTLKNNGRFSVAGYFIRGTTSETQKLAVEDLSIYNPISSDGFVILNPTGNALLPNNNENSTFNFNRSNFTRIYSIEIIPLRFQTENRKQRIVSCGNAQIKQVLSCYNETN